MANETVVVTGTVKTLEANGASIANGAVAAADDATYSISADGGGYPDAKFVASFTFGTAPVEGAAISILARPLDVDGTNDAQVPEATRPHRYIGPLIVDNVTTLQYAECIAHDVPDNASYYLYNNATGQTISAGWTLKVTPRSYKPAT